jgi:hypothetical protein
MVSECINNHETSASIREMMSEVPPELGNVYQHIIENVVKERNKPKTLLLFQLVCLPKRPLSVEELRYAMALDDAAVEHSGTWVVDSGSFAHTCEEMVGCIRTYSGGLLEIKSQRTSWNSRETSIKVQVVHQSVKDFMLLQGLSYLTPTTHDRETVAGQAHDRLRTLCTKYFAQTCLPSE